MAETMTVFKVTLDFLSCFIHKTSESSHPVLEFQIDWGFDTVLDLSKLLFPYL